jgi:hypothetical protein
VRSDGTSQAARVLPELDPDFARIDERGSAELIEFARQYAQEVKYFALEDADEARGDWSGFVSGDSSRPHFALFLAFLELLAPARARINTLTRRHLEFFYRDVLRMVRKGARPDTVHVLFELDERAGEVQVPAGTALNAGKDSLGRDLVYCTDRQLVANRAQIARVSALRAQIRRTGIREAAQQYRVSGTKADAFVSMLSIALGQPGPGDPLPVPVYPGNPPATAPQEVTFGVLQDADKLVDSVDTALGMPLFDDFRRLMGLRSARGKDEDDADWQQINDYLNKAGQKRAPGFQLAPKDPKDFDTNLRAALGLTEAEYAVLYNGLSEVKSIDEAYAVYLTRPDVQEFIQTKLYLSLDDFRAMMQIKTRIDIEWADIDRLLVAAGGRKKADFKFEGAAVARDFDAKLTAVATIEPKFDYPGGIDKFFEAFTAVEAYFYMSAERFRYIMSVAIQEQASGADPWSWERVYEIVAAAHGEMIYAQRRAALRAVAQPDPKVQPADAAKALDDMITVTLGERVPAIEAWRSRLGDLGVGASDLAYLEGISKKNEAQPDWARAARILEVAQRNREGLRAPVPEKVEWRDLYPAADARKASLAAQAAAGNLPRWKPFGLGERKRERQPAPPPSFGWAMASPLLWLQEGARTIELLLGFADGPQFDIDDNPFQVELSTAKGWLEAPEVKLAWAMPLEDPKRAGATLPTLTLSMTFAAGQPALAALSREVHGIDTEVPVMRLMLKPQWQENEGCYTTPAYAWLRRRSLVRARLKVSVTGLTSLSIANDETILDAKKPFEPFGMQPATGSRFYLGHPEIVGKKLDALTFNIIWMGAPTNLERHYQNYPDKLKNTSFQAKVSLSDSAVLKEFSGSLGLFAADATTQTSASLTPPADQGNPDTAVNTAAEVTQWNRYIVWELGAPDFQHAAYPVLALQKSLEMAMALSKPSATASDTSKPPANAVDASGAQASASGATQYQVNPPYTPKIKSLTADYQAQAEVVLDAAPGAPAAMHVYHVQPFGYAELKPEGPLPGCPFLPQYDFEGELYIGLHDVAPPQNVSLLFQMAEGSANPDADVAPLQWSYLSANRWIDMHDEGSLLADGTRGFINSGIVELSLKPAQPSTLLPDGLYWLRAAIARAPDGVCDMIEIHPNAVSATFADADNAPDHLVTPLPAGSISAARVPIAGIDRIRQPYTSFGGKMAEADTSFYVRVSERLRHKERALTAWDYERLVLEKFPQLHKVKCLQGDSGAYRREPGTIELIVIPDVRDRLPFDPFGPKAPADLIRDIEAFLADKTPPFANVKVKNAHYVPVKVRCGVRFMPGQDEGYCRRRLNEELNRFLSPWAYEDGADLVIGGSVYANSIINFIDSRDYVDYLFQFKLFTSEDGGNEFKQVAEDEHGYRASTARPDGVLVAARQHEFDVTSQADYRVEGFSGVNYMRIELDFIVS